MLLPERSYYFVTKPIDAAVNTSELRFDQNQLLGCGIFHFCIKHYQSKIQHTMNCFKGPTLLTNVGKKFIK